MEATMSIFVTKSAMPDFDEYVEEIRGIWDSRHLTNMGPKHMELERLLAEKLDVPYVSLLTNGHLALEYTLQSFEFPYGSEVITTPFTFVSTTNSIIRSGLRPVFCDIALPDYTMDAKKIEALITEKTVAIMPVHVYGNICQVEEIERIASKYGLKVIYDAAHAFGESYKGKSVFRYGDASILSFHATKVFHTIEGGAICTSSKEMYDKIWHLKDFGINGPDHIDYAGGNGKMNEFCAAMGICNLRHIDANIAARKAVAECYRENLQGIPGIVLNRQYDDCAYNYAYYPVIFDGYKENRDEIFDKLKAHDINSRKYFYPLISALDYCKEYRGSGAENTPVSAYACDHVLCLPMYPELGLDDVKHICDIIKE